MKTILIALFATLSPCFAQEAKIMIVERSDSQKLAKAYREYKDALKRWEDVKIEVAKTYTQENGKAIAGWEKIQFSADFRALVPDSSQYASHLYACNGNGWITNTGSVPAASFSSGTLTVDAIGNITRAETADTVIDQSLTVKEPKESSSVH